MSKPQCAALLLVGLIACPALAHPGHDADTTTG